MPRPRRCRRVGFLPNSAYFKPAGIRMNELETSILNVDELEAVRLKDLLGLEQEEAARKMDISQPTFHRLVLSARRKIADGLVNGKAIKIEGGNYDMIEARRGMGFMGPATMCRCTNCDYHEPKERGVPCASKRCPRCGGAMVRGD